MNILKLVPGGSHESEEVVAPSSHRSRDATLHLLNQLNPATLKVIPELHPVPILKRQIGIGVITLKEVSGSHYAAVAIDYFSN
ncbi:Gypsy retrotransposon integrase-like protein 1 [Aphis craccivora]|uniref:Gypsy retrotransposon integrase-like protein 1 n=1 Tax=Aphis craccivora TaxID=307492 RepID=A0A6G0YG96_APHCR|nr:Gypsy retrotransposon integrase-like protein 1 [Aphis craccivora]